MRGEHNIRKRMELHSIHTCRANCTESEIIATTLGDRWIGSPRSRIAAMMQAAIGPFCFWGSMPKDHRRTNSDNRLSDGAVSGLPVIRPEQRKAVGKPCYEPTIRKHRPCTNCCSRSDPPQRHTLAL